jgi:hypothetical protein
MSANAGRPEVFPDREANGLCIEVPLTAQPDERLLDAIEESPGELERGRADAEAKLQARWESPS